MIKLVRPECPDPEGLKTNYKVPVNKVALADAANGKCIYCESKVTHVYYGDVEHLKPKSKYPELEFAWTNLGFVCAKCNNAKSDKYDESCPIVNPYEEDPTEHLCAIGVLVLHYQGSERGETTWRTLDLNRSELVERRMVLIERLQKAVDACFRTTATSLHEIGREELLEEAGASAEYSLVARAFLRMHAVVPSA